MRFRRDKRHGEDKPGNLPVAAGAGADAGMSAKVLSHVLESSARLQAPAVKAYVAKLRRSAPEATPGWSHWTTRAPGSGRRVFYP